ncbi:MAG: hypothetical protein AB1758_23530 [Candidatus Eremiobacterota bacterium]
MQTVEIDYALRNAPAERFHVRAEAEGDAPGGAVVRAWVAGPSGRSFHLEVDFQPGYSASKPEFDAHMFLLTGLELIKAHIESHRHRDFRLRLVVNSGLVLSEPVPDGFPWAMKSTEVSSPSAPA